MTERERLLELLSSWCSDEEQTNKLADYLLDNGVVCLSKNETTSIIKWHKITTRPLDDEEKEYYERSNFVPEFIYDCIMPEDGQEVLVATKWGVDKDEGVWDEYGCGLDNRGDYDGVLAWAEIPIFKECESNA